MQVLRELRRCVRYPELKTTPPGLGILSLLLLFFSAETAQAQLSPAKEFQVKALFLYNFTQFVQWPPQSFAREDAPLIIGILGEDPFGSYIDELVEGEVINNHPLVVQRYATVKDMADCHLLYVNLTEKDQIRRTLDSLQTKPVLTISDADNFARMGGMIRFIREDERIRLRINTTAVTEAQLVISSKLLRLSEIVTSKNN